MTTVDERSRHELYLSIEALIGAEKADTLMSMLPSVGWADVATKQDLAAMRHDLAALEQRMEARSAALEERMNIRFDASEARILGDVNKALREQMRTMVFALIGAVFTMTSLNLTAIALLLR